MEIPKEGELKGGEVRRHSSTHRRHKSASVNGDTSPPSFAISISSSDSVLTSSRGEVPLPLSLSGSVPVSLNNSSSPSTPRGEIIVGEIDNLTKQNSLEADASIKQRSSSLERTSSKLTQQQSSGRKRDTSTSASNSPSAMQQASNTFRSIVSSSDSDFGKTRKSARDRGGSFGALISPTSQKVNRMSASLPPLPTIPVPIIDISPVGGLAGAEDNLNNSSSASTPNTGKLNLSDDNIELQDDSSSGASSGDQQLDLEKQVKSLTLSMRQKNEECEYLKRCLLRESSKSRESSKESDSVSEATKHVNNFKSSTSEVMTRFPDLDYVVIEKLFENYRDTLLWCVSELGSDAPQKLDKGETDQLLASIQSVKLEIFKREGNDILVGSARAAFTSSSDPNISYRKLSKNTRPGKGAEKGLLILKPLKLETTVVDTFCVYCKQGDLEKVQKMYSQNVNANLVNTLNSNGCTPLYYAISSDNIPVLIYILNLTHYPILNAKLESLNGGTVLHYAITTSSGNTNTKLDTIIALLIARGIDLTIANNDGVVARALLPATASSDEDNVFEIFANSQIEGLRQSWPVVSEVINLNKTDLYSPHSQRRDTLPDGSRPISPGRERHKDNKFASLDALLSPRPKKTSSGPKGSEEKGKKSRKSARDSTRDRSDSEDLSFNDLINQFRSEIDLSDVVIHMPPFSKDPLQPGPRLKFQVQGSVNSLGCCVKSRVTPPLNDPNTNSNQSSNQSSPSTTPLAPHAHQLPISLQHQSSPSATQPQAQGSVTIATISLLNDVKIAVDPSFKLTRFDPVFTRKFLAEAPLVWACIETYQEVIDGILPFYLISVFYKEDTVRFVKFSGKGYTEWGHVINKPVLDPSKNTIPWLTKEGELSKKRVEKEIERLSKPTVQYQMFPSTLELYERLAKIDSFRFTFFHKMTVGVFFLSKHDAKSSTKLTLKKLIKSATNSPTLSPEYLYFIHILRAASQGVELKEKSNEPLQPSYDIVWNNISITFAISSVLSKDDIRRIIGNSMMNIIYNDSDEVIDPSELSFGSVTISVCVVQKFVPKDVANLSGLSLYKLSFFMYFERKVAAENALEDLKAIEIKMSEIRFAPEIQCESVFDERNVTTIILSKLCNSLYAALSFHAVQKQLTTPVSNKIQDVVLKYFPDWLNKIYALAATEKKKADSSAKK